MFKGSYCLIFILLAGCSVPTSSLNSDVEKPVDPYAGGNHPPVASFPSWDYEVTGSEVTEVNQHYTESGANFGKLMYTGDGNPSYKLFAFMTNESDCAWGLHTSIDSLVDPASFTYYQLSDCTFPPADIWLYSSNNTASDLTIISVPIEGDLSSVGNLLSAQYSYSDSDDHSEDGTSYQWYRCGNPADNGIVIDGATSMTYTIVAADNDKYLKFEVTPVDSQGLAGTPVMSKATSQIGG